jgi:glycosyltransferase involved in cell wall biosynthesis
MMPGLDPDRLKVLFVSGLQIHPTRSGGTLRSFALASALRHCGVDVRVHALTGRKADYLARRPSSVQLWPDGTEEEVERGVLSAVDWLAGYVVAPPPVWIAARLAAGAVSPGERLLSRSLREKMAWCDAILADFPFCAPIFSAPSARGKLRILSTHNVEHRLFDPDRWPGRLMRAVVRKVEVRAAEACDVLVSCCAEDAQFFETHTRAPQTVVVPNGIDPRRFQGIDAHRRETRRALGIADTVKVLLFTGSRWGPNREAFEYLLAFARTHASLLAKHELHILVVGNVAAERIRLPGFTATGRVERVEPYFAAADAGINPMRSGAGTNVKMGEFIAARLPVLSTAFGVRGFDFADGETGFLFAPDTLASVLPEVRRLFDADPGHLRRMAANAWARNESRVDMAVGLRPLLEWLGRHRARPTGNREAPRMGTRPPAA